MADNQSTQESWNAQQTQWRRNLIQHMAQSLEFKMLLHQADAEIFEQRFGLVITQVQDQVVVNLKEDC